MLNQGKTRITMLGMVYLMRYRPNISLSVRLAVCLYVCLSFCLSLHLFGCIAACPSFLPSVSVSSPNVCPSVCFVYLSQNYFLFHYPYLYTYPFSFLVLEIAFHPSIYLLRCPSIDQSISGFFLTVILHVSFFYRLALYL